MQYKGRILLIQNNFISMKSSITKRTIWNIAYPIMFGNLAQTLITLTDTAFLGRVSAIALGASMMADRKSVV